MNRVYSIAFAIGLSLIVNAPTSTFAQCGFCTGGVPATKVTQLIPVGPTNASSSNVVFNKYYDATGKTMLSCYSFDDTLSATSGFDVANTDPDSVIYNFHTTLNYTIKGPGLSSGLNFTESATKDYGPDTLAPISQPGSTITLGPDVYFNQKISSVSNVFSTTPYSGPGTLNINITFGGGAVAAGGTNYTYTIATTYTAMFKLTYYICPTVALATSIEDFTAIQSGDIFNIQWLTANEQTNINYEIEVSTDGKTFNSAGQVPGDPAAAGVTAKYQYQYHVDPANVGKLSFRIKRIDADKKVSYSAILTVNNGSSGDGSQNFHIYPNPATNNLVFQFEHNQTGRFLVQLVSASGQIVQQKATTLSGANQLRLDLDAQPVKGLYFLQTTDLSHGRKYISKVFIE